MTVQKLTTWETEADLEAAIYLGLRTAFPWLPQGSLRHQTKFAFQFGRSKIQVDGATASRSEARADVLIYWNDIPLAVLELKRPGVPLHKADEEQGLSYARMLHPRPPLVVITNGSDVRILEAHTGSGWTPTEANEVAFQQLLAAASRVSAGDLKRAVSTLMGSSPDIWQQAVRQTSAAIIAELSGDWDDPGRPFVPGFLLPRRATEGILQLLKRGSRLVTLEGAPLVGKSNVLRELVERTGDDNDLVVLLLEAESGNGVFQKIADVLRSALNWPVTQDEAREWVSRLSHANELALVLAIDGPGVDGDRIRRDIEDLTSNSFGDGVRVVAAIDDIVAERMMLNSTGRRKSPIGRRADRIPMGLLDNAEFEAAMHAMRLSRLTMVPGADSAEELRTPWVLRAAASRYGTHERDDAFGAIPPLLGLELIDHTRDQFTEDELRRLFRQVAAAILVDSRDRKRPIALILQSTSAFVVRRSTLRGFLEPAEMTSLLEQGLIRLFQPRSGEALMVIRHMELLASEIADLLGSELAKRAEEDPEKAARWIAGVAGSLPLGDIVTAQAICDGALHHGGLPMNFLIELLQTPPKRHKVEPGTRSAIYFPGLGTFEMVFREGGAISFEVGGVRRDIEPDPGEEEHTAYSDFHPWLILSHLAGRHFIMRTGSETGDSARIDPVLLLEVGTCATVLRRPGGDPDVVGVLTHDLPEGVSIVCHLAGIVEPITWSMFRYLSAEGQDADSWIEEAIQRKSLPLLTRIDIALRQLASTSDADAAHWAQHALLTKVKPAMRDLPELHPE